MNVITQSVSGNKDLEKRLELAWYALCHNERVKAGTAISEREAIEGAVEQIEALAVRNQVRILDNKKLYKGAKKS